MRQVEIGAALDSLESDVRTTVLWLAAQYRQHPVATVLKQSVDTPHRARAQITAWIANYNARHGGSGGSAFLAVCLTAAQSSKTLATIDIALAALEAQAQVVVGHVNNDGWTWDQVATAIEAAIVPAVEESLSFRELPIPSGYTTVWGEPW